MLNEDKIRLMTKAAAFEAGEGKKALSVNKYFRGDFISLHLIGAWFSFTVAFCLCGAVWAFYHMEELMTGLHKMNLPALGKAVGLLYLSLLAIYLIINYVVYRDRYQKNRRNLGMYYHILKRIAHIYQTESGDADADFTTGGTDKDDDLTGI